MKVKKIIVVGGGPAGLMAAGQAACAGADVLLLEKKGRPGEKFRLTGNGRCNVTNTAPMAEFIRRYHSDRRFLQCIFSAFSPLDLRLFLKQAGLATTVEADGRVFPASGRGAGLVERLVGWVVGCGVRIQTDTAVRALLLSDTTVIGVLAGDRDSTGQGCSMQADCVIVATGGASYAHTGSAGDGYAFARQAGHSIVPVRAALVPLVSADARRYGLQGLTLCGVSAGLIVDGKRVSVSSGSLLFTHFGISGPAVLTLSRDAVSALQARRNVEVSLDLEPAVDERQLDNELRRSFDDHGTRHFATLMKERLPSRLIPVCCAVTNITGDKPGHQITSAERGCLRRWLKDFRISVSGHRGFGEAMVTSGGVAVSDVDPATMKSRLASGLFFAGEVLDIDGDTGGFNLQAAFTTGWIAGRGAAMMGGSR